MKKLSKILSFIPKKWIAISLLIITGCRKEHPILTTHVSYETHTYHSLKDFYSQNGVPMQTYIIDASTGGTFTSPQGTVVTIPENAFVTQAGIPVTGNVTMQFKDIYKKSDMLLSNMDTREWSGKPLLSGGEFFIKVIFGNEVVNLASQSVITVKQPFNSSQTNNILMDAFTFENDSFGIGWWNSQSNSVTNGSQAYTFNLHEFYPLDSGTWSNSDNSTFFSSYMQTSLTLHANEDISTYQTDVFLIFKNINSIVEVYGNGTDFPYSYAPQGFQCTLVAIGLKGGKLYSSFVPININANQTVPFSLSQTTTDTFKSQLRAIQ
jgi:hypothetical protein